MTRAELSVRKFGRGGRAFAPDFRSASCPRHRGFDPARPLLCGETSARRTGKRRAFDRNPGRAPGFCSEISVDHRDFKPKLRRGATETPRRSFAPRQRAGRPGGCAARSKALSAQSTAVSRHACGRPRRGAVAAVLPHWSHDNGRLPGGRLTLQLPPPANGHGRGALCERRNGTASAQWAPRLPGQPASRLHLQALVRVAFDHFDPDRRGLWVRHAGTRAQSNTHAARGLTVRRSPSGARVATWCHAVATWCHSRASWCDLLVSPV